MAILTYTDSYAELNALFCAVFSGAWSTIAQNAASPATNLYVSLHNADPGPTGSQNTNETAYTNYARVAVARTTGGWTVTQGSGTTFTNVVNAAQIAFAACGATGDTLTHWGIGLASSGAGTLLAFGPLGPTAGPAIPFTCTSASPGVLSVYGYTPAVNDRVSVYQLVGTEGLPTGLTEGTVYYVGTAPGGQTLTLSTTTANGNPVNTSSTGSGILYKQSPLVVSSGITPSIAAAAMSLQKA
jgi:hypothetical protein